MQIDPEDKERTMQFHISESGNAIKFIKCHTEGFLTSSAVFKVSEQMEGVFIIGHLHALKVSSGPEHCLQLVPLNADPLSPTLSTTPHCPWLARSWFSTVYTKLASECFQPLEKSDLNQNGYDVVSYFLLVGKGRVLLGPWSWELEIAMCLLFWFS